MERVGVLIVSKCLSGSAYMDAFRRSDKYAPEFYVVAKQENPALSSGAREHHVSPNLDLDVITKVAKRNRARIAFGVTDTEDFVTGGGRDALESAAGVDMICVSKKFAVEASKADQRLLFDRVFPGANPEFQVFDPKRIRSREEARRRFRKALQAIPSPVVKPDAPARGAGVGVWGSDFHTAEEAEAFFLGLLDKGRVVVEEKVEGEESSFHALSDGRHFVPLPMTRDYKRSFERNAGALTGGMGSYRGPSPQLPFLSPSDWDDLVGREERAYRKWKGKGSEPGLRGIVLYDAIMHTGSGFRVLERNSRGGNTEIINLLTTIEDDLVDVCYRILDGSLRDVRFAKKASVVTCAVPLSYGTRETAGATGQPIDISTLDRLAEASGGRLRSFPMDVRLDDNRTVMGTSRAVAVAGIDGSVDEARRISIVGCRSLRGAVRWRSDIAGRSDIAASRRHLRRLRRPSA